jgi:3-hydroxyacyl-[acyl-carrier-protein] dehydratase
MRWMWIDRIVELVPKTSITTIKNVSLAEEHLHDHFEATANRPAMPIMPMSLIIEGMAQTAGILVGHAEDFREKVVLAKVSKAVLTRDALPGCTLRYSATIQQLTPQGASTTGIVELIDHAAGSSEPVQIGQIDLMFSHIDQNMGGLEFPEHNFVFSSSFKTLLRTSGIETTFEPINE